MSERVPLGIDCGGLRLRAVYLDGPRLSSLSLPGEDKESLLLFDPTRNISSIGVSFPGLLQSVGSRAALGGHKRDQTPEGLVTARFRRLVQALAEAGKQPGETVLAVPAGLEAGKREALLECARTAGIETVALMDKSTASAQGYQSWLGKAVTALVVELGYDYCEYALVRVARGQRAVVAAKGFPDVSGEMLDAIVMEGLILALRKRRMFLGLKQWSGSEWLLYRKVAEELRKTLVRYAESMILLPSKLTRLDRELKVRLSRDAFARRVAALLSCVVESIQGALEQNGLEVKDVDALLLTGGVARTVPVREIFLQALGGKPHVTDPHLSAVGAACQAARTGDGAVHWDGPPLAVDVSSELSASDASAWWPPPRKPEDEEFIEVVDEDTAGPTNAALLVEKPSLERVRELIGEGKYRLAATVLDAVADEVEELRQQLAHGDRPSPQQYLEQARRRLEARQCEEAVALAHKAFEAAPEDPAVFDAMMQVHADAGLRLDRPEEFSAAVAILTCAHRHDQTNRTIHRAMCERHYRHAVAMLSSKEPAEALAALQAGLAYDPKHAGASQLLQELSRPSA